VPNPTCGDSRSGTVMEALLWVKCPTKAKQARNILDYGKTAMASHKTHMPCRKRPASRAAAARMPGAPVMPVAAASKMLVNVFGGARQDFVPACMVDASARCESVTLLARGAAAQTLTGPVRATGRQAGATALRAGAVHAFGATARVAATGRGLVVRWTRSARGGEVPPPVRGLRPAVRRLPSVGRDDAFGKGQKTYFTTDWTGDRGMPGGLRLSRCETSLGARDLLLTTLSNNMCVQSNIFGFVMT
jgi:hypothetical protein